MQQDQPHEVHTMSHLVHGVRADNLWVVLFFVHRETNVQYTENSVCTVQIPSSFFSVMAYLIFVWHVYGASLCCNSPKDSNMTHWRTPSVAVAPSHTERGRSRRFAPPNLPYFPVSRDHRVHVEPPAPTASIYPSLLALVGTLETAILGSGLQQ